MVRHIERFSQEFHRISSRRFVLTAAAVASLLASRASAVVTEAGLLTSYGSNLLGYWPQQDAAGAGRVQDFSLNLNHALVNSITPSTPRANGNIVDTTGASITLGTPGPRGASVSVKFPGGSADPNLAGASQNNRHLEPGILNVGAVASSTTSFDDSFLFNGINNRGGSPNSVTPTVTGTYDPIPYANPMKLLPSTNSSGNYYVSGATYQSGVQGNLDLTYTGGTQVQLNGGLQGKTPVTLLTWYRRHNVIVGRPTGDEQIMGTARQDIKNATNGGYGLTFGSNKFGIVRHLSTGQNDFVFQSTASTLALDEWAFVAATWDPTQSTNATRFKIYFGKATDSDLVSLPLDVTTVSASPTDWGDPNTAAGRSFFLGGGKDPRWAADASTAHSAVLSTALSQAQLEAIFDARTEVISGDASLDGTVNALDFNALASNFGAVAKNWKDGDFNADSIVDSADFTLLAQHFNQSLPAPAVGLGGLVPEPSSALLVIGAASMLAVNRKRRVCWS